MADARAHDEATDLVIRLFEQYHVPVFAYLYRLVRDREWANDLTEDTFLRLFEARHRLPQIENRRAWIYRIATNLAFRALKRRNRFAWLPWRQDDSLHTNMPDPSDQVQFQSEVEGALASLSPTERAPLLLYYYYGFSVREVADALDLSEGAVKVRLHRARESFRKGYEKGVVHE